MDAVRKVHRNASDITLLACFNYYFWHACRAVALALAKPRSTRPPDYVFALQCRWANTNLPMRIAGNMYVEHPNKALALWKQDVKCAPFNVQYRALNSHLLALRTVGSWTIEELGDPKFCAIYAHRQIENFLFSPMLQQFVHYSSSYIHIICIGLGMQHIT